MGKSRNWQANPEMIGKKSEHYGTLDFGGEIVEIGSVFARARVFRQCAWPALRRARRDMGARAKALLRLERIYSLVGAGWNRRAGKLLSIEVASAIRQEISALDGWNKRKTFEFEFCLGPLEIKLNFKEGR
jgi:hypothetical protein